MVIVRFGRSISSQRRLKGSQDSSHYLERDEVAGLKALQRLYATQGRVSGYVFTNERGQPFSRAFYLSPLRWHASTQLSSSACPRACFS